MAVVRINKKDNVAVELDTGHKIALCDIKSGQAVIKYGFEIGKAASDIKEGEAVHTHNLKTGLDGILEYEYAPYVASTQTESPFMIKAYVRENGDVGIRNDIWIVNTVGCINKTAQKLSELTGALCFTHPYGCSQLGSDKDITEKILCGLITHPNAGGVLVLGLGCENSNIKELKKRLPEKLSGRVRFLNIQDCTDEIYEGVKIISELKSLASEDIRTEVPVNRLKIGLKCGGSDGLSGITANPAVGRVTDTVVAMGGCAVLTEVPEMFGAETVLFKRCVSESVFNKCVSLINDYKGYFASHSQPISENPSPGNRDGGITTLEEKSLGCVQKGGNAPVVDVLHYGDVARKCGLNLLEGPGNDLVAITNLTVAGCQLILFTTGRGTPLGAPVPTIKIASNSTIFERKPHWIDVCAQGLSTAATASEILDCIKRVSDGEPAKNEINGAREIAIFKQGVTL